MESMKLSFDTETMLFARHTMAMTILFLQLSIV